MPPLRGVIHASGVRDDGVLLTLDVQRLRAVMQSIPSACTLEIVAGGDHSYRPPSAPDGSDEYLSQAVDAVTRWLAVQIGD